MSSSKGGDIHSISIIFSPRNSQRKPIDARLVFNVIPSFIASNYSWLSTTNIDTTPCSSLWYVHMGLYFPSNLLRSMYHLQSKFSDVLCVAYKRYTLYAQFNQPVKYSLVQEMRWWRTRTNQGFRAISEISSWDYQVTEMWLTVIREELFALFQTVHIQCFPHVPSHHNFL